tara:strand:- start:47 stop:394 length:348 start_codon:yes stop_codon:yes gene_type:complete
METNKYSPVLISQLMQDYRENIKKKYENKKGLLEKSVNNIKTVYNNIYENVNSKLHTSYTHEDLDKEKNLNSTEFKIKEYGIFLGNLVTNVIVDSVDNYNSVKELTYNYLYPTKE